jgi:hypothetical protein
LTTARRPKIPDSATGALFQCPDLLPVFRVSMESEAALLLRRLARPRLTLAALETDLGADWRSDGWWAGGGKRKTA